jgi:glycosyltransferase involved in cell wall biosynthesis
VVSPTPARRSRSCLHLLIVGDGPEKTPLEDQARALGVEKNVTLTGSQKNVCPYLQAADIFILPSFTEGISNALLEAMSAGLACMATPVGGSNEVLAQGRYGKMIPVADIRAWAEAFVELGNDASQRRRLGGLARQRILDTYDFNIVGTQYEALYNELLHR